MAYVIVDGRKFNAKTFTSAVKTNKFLEKNSQYGVLTVKGKQIFVVRNDDNGKPVKTI